MEDGRLKIKAFKKSRRRFISDGLRYLGTGGALTIVSPSLLSASTDQAAKVAQRNTNPARSAADGSHSRGTINLARAPSSMAVRFDLVGSFNIAEARQGVAVDEKHFYAIDNRTIAKYRKWSQERAGLWQGAENGPIKHFNSATAINERLYLAHSNYPEWPPASSIEVFDAQLLTHTGSHSFGIDIGSLTWIDLAPNGRWFGGFATYDRVFDNQRTRCCDNVFTQIVEFDDRWQVVQRWTLPAALIERFAAMSNSGGSWGADNRLYLTGHDHAETYVMMLPKAGPALDWVDTISLHNTGQGIAWDRTRADDLYAIVRSENRTNTNKVTINRIIWADQNGKTR